MSRQLQVFCNVYDLHPMNHHLYSFGLGAYHSGIEVCGAEYTFGSHDADSSAVVAIPPKTAPGCTFRESVPLGTTQLSSSEVRALANRMGEETFFGTAYDLVRRNCNHFSAAFAVALGAQHPPYWINRLAWLGATFPCLDPRFALQLLQPPTQQSLEAPPPQQQQQQQQQRARQQAASSTQPIYARALDAEPSEAERAELRRLMLEAVQQRQAAAAAAAAASSSQAAPLLARQPSTNMMDFN